MRAIALVAAVLCLAQMPVSAQEQDWRAQVDHLLAARARAVLAGDTKAFDATMSNAPASFKRAKDLWLKRLRALGLITYSLERASDSYEDLRDALVSHTQNVHVIEAIERIALTNFSADPSVESVVLTVARAGTTWSIVSDTSLDDLGVRSARAQWDFTDVRRLDDGDVTVLYEGSRSAANGIATASRSALAYVRARWPVRVKRRALVELPRSSAELSRMLDTTTDIGPFVAFTSASVEQTKTGYANTGARIAVQPDTFYANSASFRTDVLSHEMLHLVTRPEAGFFTTAWLEEGIALIYGERHPIPTVDIRKHARSITGLPQDYQFVFGSRSEIKAAYQESADFIRMLRARYDTTKVARFYDAVGAESPVSFGTAGYHLDHAARAAFGTSFDALERAWVAKVKREFA